MNLMESLIQLMNIKKSVHTAQKINSIYNKNKNQFTDYFFDVFLTVHHSIDLFHLPILCLSFRAS